VIRIEKEAFRQCESLADITIPASVERIGEAAFCDCRNLMSITIPNSVTDLGKGAFIGVGEVNIEQDNPHYISVNGILYSNDKKTLIHYALNKQASAFVIPDFVVHIGESAFRGCRTLTNVTIPSSVEGIGKSAFSDCENLTNVTIADSVKIIGEEAFFGCTNLKNITILSTVTSIGKAAFAGVGEIRVADDHPCCMSIDGVLYSKDGKQLLCYPRNKMDACFVIPDFVTEIAPSAFMDCKNLVRVTVSRSVESIGDGAFQKCGNLADIIMFNSVTSIGAYTFTACENLKTIRYKGSADQWRRIRFGAHWRSDVLQTVKCKLGKIKL
jgi:hypothetical protein